MAWSPSQSSAAPGSPRYNPDLMKKILLFFLTLGIALATVLWVRYGGGAPYPNLAGPPLLVENALEEVLAYP